MLAETASGLHVVAEQSSSDASQQAAAVLESMPDEELIYELADLYKVFSDATRVKIMYALAGGELCVASIGEVTSSTQSAVSHQLRILKQAHLVRARREGRNVLYALADDHVLTLLETGMEHICE